MKYTDYYWLKKAIYYLLQIDNVTHSPTQTLIVKKGTRVYILKTQLLWLKDLSYHGVTNQDGCQSVGGLIAFSTPTSNTYPQGNILMGRGKPLFVFKM